LRMGSSSGRDRAGFDWPNVDATVSICLHPAAMEAALKAIAEPRRRQILRLVWDAERSAGDIASHFDVSRPAISQHLTVLRTAGLVTERRDGARRLYRANRHALAELQASLQAFWSGSLAALKEEVEAEEGRRRGRRRVHRQQ
jgi:DNA-binding transcriptional ArsR family regulator